MSKKWKYLLQKEMEQDAKSIMEEVNSDPSLKDVKAPDEIHEKLMQQIREHEGVSELHVLSAEEKELIRLGRVYQKRRRWNRYAVLAAAVICVLAMGITSLGGPERVIEAMKQMVGTRQQTQIDVEGEKLVNSGISTEEEAYQQIEDIFEIFPVRFYYVPDGMKFSEIVIEEETHNARLYYEKGSEKMLSCTMWFNYRPSSRGMDIEDTILEDYNIEVAGNAVSVKKYAIDGQDSARWKLDFQYQKVQYFVTMEGFTEEEANKTIKNLHFFEK